MSLFNCKECERVKSSGFYMCTWQVYIVLYIMGTNLYHISFFFICVAFIVDISGLLKITSWT